MAVDSNFEAYIGLSLAAELKALSGLGSMPVQQFGARVPVAESVMDWLAVDILSIHRLNARRGVWHGDVLFQITAFARDGAERSDGITDAARRTAGIVARGLEQKHIAIKKYGVDSSVLADLAISHPDMVTLPPREGMNVWGVSVTFHGQIQTG